MTASSGPTYSGSTESTEGSLVVPAPRERVLVVLTDLEAYPEWNAEFRSVQVLARDEAGRPASARIVLDSAALRDELVLDYYWAAGPSESAGPSGSFGTSGFSWVLREPGSVVRRMDGAYSLQDTGGGGTTVTFRLGVDIAFPLIGALRRKAEQTVIDRALTGLAQRVEETTWD